MDELVIGLSVEWHLQNQMELEIIYLDISLLIIELMYFHLKTVLNQRNLDLLPDLELVTEIDQDFDRQVDITQVKSILIPHYLLVTLTLNILKLKSMLSLQILQP